MTKRNSQLPEIWRRYKKNKVAMVGLVILIFIILIAVFADVIVPYEKCIEQVGSERLQGPSAAHWFGTDDLVRKSDTWIQIFSVNRRLYQSDGIGCRCNPWCKCRIFWRYG